MKKFILSAAASCMLFVSAPREILAHEKNTVKIETAASEKQQAEKLIQRLREIKSMDISKLTAAEKSTLRKEVLSIREQLEPLGGGVYISAGALLIIILLILLL